MIEISSVISEYGKHIMGKFEFENGDVLEDVCVEYLIKGTPKYDEEGNITNAILYCHNFGGDCSSLNDISLLMVEEGPFDLNKYLLISISSLGFPQSCCPSSTGLKYNFPKYTVEDCVNFKRQFIKEKFNLDSVLGIISHGLGGYEAFSWACDYPDNVKFIIVCGSFYKTSGYRYVVSKGIASIIESSEEYYEDVYSDSLAQIMVSISKLLYSNYFSKKIFQKMSREEIDVLMDHFGEEGLYVDVYDFKYRNDSIISFDDEDKLENITSKILLVNPDDDVYYSQEELLSIKNVVKDAEVLIFESADDYLKYDDYSVFSDEFTSFMKKNNF